MYVGNYESAAKTYHQLLDLPLALNDNQAVQSQLGLGKAHMREGNYDQAIAAFENLLSAHPEHDTAPQAHFLLADALVAAGKPLSATKSYSNYLSTSTVITPYVYQSQGEALLAGEAYTAAIEAYTRALDDAPDASFEVGTREKIAQAHLELANYEAAVEQYDAILDVARIPTYRARIEYKAAEALLQAAETEAGYERHRTVVETYYQVHSFQGEYYPYLSLKKLVEAGVPIDNLVRGIVDYYGGAYGAAVQALYNYINAYPEAHSGDAHWYAGLSFAEAGSPELALNEFDLLIETHPNNDYWGEAWLQKAQVKVNQGDGEAALTIYHEFVDRAPDHPLAPQALWKAAQLTEQTDNAEAAGEAYMNVQTTYPESDYGPQALYQSGLQFYQTEAWVDAAVAWDTLTQIYPNSPYRPAALLWLGKLRRQQGDDEAAQSAFEEASADAPLDYYGLRATQLAVEPDAPIFPRTEYTPSQRTIEQTEAEEWLAEWLALETSEGLDKPSHILAADGRLQRGEELWRLGRFQEAKWELENLRRATRSDALSQYQLALAYRDMGLYRSSILCAARLLSMSPVTTTLNAPDFIVQLAYPTYYEDLVVENARHNDLDPLLVFALVRQESLFEGGATSIASAQGLMQVMPATGAEIAADLEWPPNYETTDLYRPYVSVRFGTHYLAKQRDRFSGRIDAALAGYNGGPSNAQRWLEQAGEDPDRFFERISFGETRSYLERIREHLAIYQALYGS
jgi:soluble lytic murein transglycosylase